MPWNICATNVALCTQPRNSLPVARCLWIFPSLPVAPGDCKAVGRQSAWNNGPYCEASIRNICGAWSVRWSVRAGSWHWNNGPALQPRGWEWGQDVPAGRPGLASSRGSDAFSKLAGDLTHARERQSLKGKQSTFYVLYMARKVATAWYPFNQRFLT